MASYLERYQRGEREQVWAELVALGDQVRSEPLHTDALAVARETMGRVRQNIEVLIPRLVAIGYQFGYGWVQPFVRERLLRPYRVSYPLGRHGQLVDPAIPERFSYAYRIAYEEYLEMAQTMPPLFVPANDREERIAVLARTIAATAPSQEVFLQQVRATQAELRAKPSAQDMLAELEALLGTLPLSVLAWYEEVGGVNFVGDHPEWRQLLPEMVSDYPISECDYLNPMHVLDPLMIYPLSETELARTRSWAQPGKARQTLNLAPDEYGKYLDSDKGAYQIILPDASVDAQAFYPHGRMFVAYVRECFHWGGFPGWAKLEKRPEHDLAFLTQDLLPI